LLLATHGIAARLAAEVLGPALRTGALRTLPLPALSQVEFDHLLWSSDINIVRGEDSFVRAMWAARPFIWHIYPQLDGVHARKLQAFHDLYLHGGEETFAAQFEALSYRFNGLSAGTLVLPPVAPWLAHNARWREHLLRQEDLVTQLRALAVGTG
jgi:uncharacterized repeat protein (TIGR03837 family)